MSDDRLPPSYSADPAAPPERIPVRPDAGLRAGGDGGGAQPRLGLSAGAWADAGGAGTATATGAQGRLAEKLSASGRI